MKILETMSNSTEPLSQVEIAGILGVKEYRVLRCIKRLVHDHKVEMSGRKPLAGGRGRPRFVYRVVTAPPTN
jgi:predicted ArsR family transcriptional regulator